MWFPASTTITVWYNHALQSQLLSSRSIPSTLYSIVVRLESLCCCWNFWDITCIKYTQQLHFNFFFHLKCLALSLYCDMLGDHFNFTSASLDLARHKIIHLLSIAWNSQPSKPPSLDQSRTVAFPYKQNEMSIEKQNPFPINTISVILYFPCCCQLIFHDLYTNI